MQVKLVMTTQQIKDGATNATRNFHNFYLELPNNARIQVKPSFQDDYYKLRLIAESVE